MKKRRLLARVESRSGRPFYEIEAAREGWLIREPGRRAAAQASHPTGRENGDGEG